VYTNFRTLQRVCCIQLSWGQHIPLQLLPIWVPLSLLDRSSFAPATSKKNKHKSLKIGKTQIIGAFYYAFPGNPENVWTPHHRAVEGYVCYSHEELFV